MLLALATAAWGGEPTILILPGTGAPEESVLIELLQAVGFDVEETKGTRRFSQRARLISGPSEIDVECRTVFTADELSDRLAAAKSKYQTLDLPGALADYASIDLDLPCASGPVLADYFFALDIARAEANLDLSSASMSADPEKAAFFAQEAAAALDRAAVIGSSLPPPKELDRTVRAALAAARDRRDAALLPRWAVLAPDGDETFVNGVLSRAGGQAGVVGENLVQVVRDGEVVASARFALRSGDAVVIDPAGRFEPDAPTEVMDSLVRTVPDAAEKALLAAVASVIEPVAAVGFAGWEGREAVVWVASEGKLRRVGANSAVARRAPEPTEPRLPDPPRVEATKKPPSSTKTTPKGAQFTRARRLDEWVASAGVGLGAGWRGPRFDGSAESDGELSISLAGRVRLVPQLSLAWAVTPTGATSTFDPSGAGVVGDVPVRLGARWGQHLARFSPDAGVDLGLRFAPDAAGITQAAPMLAVCAGGSGASGKSTAVRLEACAGFGSDVVRLGLTLGVESRLGPG